MSVGGWEWGSVRLDLSGKVTVVTGASPHGQGQETSFTQIVADFRASYVLRYTPKGVDRGGWHTLAVRVTRPGAFNVRARAGYTGG